MCFYFGIGVKGDEITLQGERFEERCDAITVTLGDTPCDVTHCEATSITCKVGE